MSEFKNYHPVVNLVYFISVIGFSMFIMHPLCLLISLFCAFVLLAVLKGINVVKSGLKYTLPSLFLMAAINPAFNHDGATILAYFPGGNPLTLESVCYGFAAASMMISVICWFSCFNEIMTSDKIIFIFGKPAPSVSLIISMTLRFVPRLAQYIKHASNAQKCLGHSISEGNILKRTKTGVKILSSAISWSMENAVEISDSMKARGYGLKGRSFYSIFNFDKRDKSSLFLILILNCCIVAGIISAKLRFSYFPYVKYAEISFSSVAVFIAYFILCFYPVIIEIREVRRWKALK
ncbi:MAG: energy-coupling factor transporter transmembrane protein EcfT [Clostridia bacterium]|nr:energy-coupling factor transporter transmembrane protein EcfT [Clostridia bacterium]